MPELLGGRRILVVEDEYLAALDMTQMVEEQGGTVVGPVARLDPALELAHSEPLDGAILDVNLAGNTSFPIADTLLAQGVPVVFATGYDASMLPDRFAATPRLAKPFSKTAVETALRQAFGRN